jgi:hypothetical protein
MSPQWQKSHHGEKNRENDTESAVGGALTFLFSV